MNSTYKDPLDYIFKIIKYIIEKENYKNKDYVIKAFGNCVGSKLRGEKYDEVKLIQEHGGLIDQLIVILSIRDVIIENIR